jgi:hypothetical protein
MSRLPRCYKFSNKGNDVLYRFTDDEAALLTELLICRVMELSTQLGGEHAELSRAVFLQSVRILAELHQPTPSMRAALGSPGGANELGIEMVTAAALEGVDLKKELGDGIDRERAGRPRCRHGRLFTEPCADCSADSPHTPFALAAEEQRAMDEALSQRMSICWSAGVAGVCHLPKDHEGEHQFT